MSPNLDELWMNRGEDGPHAVASEGFCGLLRAPNGAALAVLGLLEFVPGPGLRERTPNLYRRGGPGKVYIIPPEPWQLALSEPAMQGDGGLEVRCSVP